MPSLHISCSEGRARLVNFATKLLLFSSRKSMVTYDVPFFFFLTLLSCRGPTSDTQSYFSDLCLPCSSYQCLDLLFWDLNYFAFILFSLFTQDPIQENICLLRNTWLRFDLKINVGKQAREQEALS